ncbi:MAG: hypothetical protein D6740_05350 [Alphaproteobacteria bacterium]|nr:MAG: hypothetical protein D6740_05350 [Alphaproteobacteria bacterium]
MTEESTSLPPKDWLRRKPVQLGIAATVCVMLLALAGLWWARHAHQQPSPAVDNRPVGASGLPLPRFVSISARRANLRSGPGRAYPVRWVYTRRNWPLKVIREYGVWRQVEDIDGTTGWMHAALLSGRRFGVIRADRPVALHAKPRPDSVVLYRAEPGVLVRILRCGPAWCRVRIAGGKAWIQKTALWGVLPREIID